MSELKLPRLLAAAKEFNVGQDTIVEFLVAKGFNKDDLKPTAKLGEDMYLSLQREFQGDKQAKNKADLVEIPKGVQQEGRKRRDEEEISFVKKDERKPTTAVPPAQPAAPAPAPAPAPVAAAPVVEAPAPALVVAPEPAPAPAPEPVMQAEPVVVEAPPAPAPVNEKPVPAPVEDPLPPTGAPAAPIEEPVTAPKEEGGGTMRIEAPEIEGLKVINKIDLSTIDSSTRPKKGMKRRDEGDAPAPAVAPRPAPAPAPVSGPVAPAPAAPAPAPQVRQPAPIPMPQQQPAAPLAPAAMAPAASLEVSMPVVTNIKADRIEGPKILGKIELPVHNDTRPKPNQEKRKRKRIPVDRKGDAPVQNPNQQTQGTPGGFRPGITPRQPDRPQPQPGSRPPMGGGFNRPPQGGPGGPRPGQPAGTGVPPSGNRFGPRSSDNKRREDKEIDQKEIQEKIRETQAKLAGGGGRGKSLKAKYRKAKRDGVSDHAGMDGADDNKLLVTEFISVSELANMMDVSFAEVIGKCMGLGIMVSINQRLDAEVIELVAGEFGYDVEFIDMEAQAELEDEEDDDDADELVPRAPIVTIMGHVDHGKTSLLDYIRSANVVAGEAGGITQHIGAYEVTNSAGKKITFLDTPGHEAFTAMRARGAKVTDISVIVVAADDAVMPQTKEAISHSQAASVPMIFAVNKIDKEGANPQKIYEQLASMNLLVEEWGGKFQSQELSAKKGQNVDLLLEKILLEAELLDLKANPNREATGTIVEATLDKGRGYVATLLVQNGTLKQGDIMVSGQFYGKIKAMFNERNQRLTEAPPATPVLVLGLNGAPQAGEKFKVYEDEAEAKEIATKRAQILREQGLRARKHITLDEIGRRLALGNFKELNLIIKGDVDGSVEALSDSLQKLSTEEIAVRVVHKGVGQISESDVLLATASDAILIGFNVRPSLQAAKVAETEGLEIKLYSIIYTAIDEIKSAMEGMLEPKFQEKITANVEVKEVYKFDKATVAGCIVIEGKIFRNSKIRVIRDGIVEHPKGEGASAELGSLKRFKDDVKEVTTNMECGLTVRNYSDLRVGDIIEAFEEEEVKRTL
ncbi:translation initiation factor IF-2 [Segetibacter sp. 3557_3]|uniref:translation initiation factor IF-2 n=1 Tax=Segetibacter sp. 3557_3 TaxID=2547429 RepID=UPI001058498A|nr:translation initiation factor IF-2 [Segetibacter sp. 3557_3]TDH23989.1 translation initiation factor IF-2 [Segetibacter sp. 3557_3]